MYILMNTYFNKINLYSFTLLFIYYFFLYKYNFILNFFFSFLFFYLFKNYFFIKKIIFFLKKTKLEILKIIWPSYNEIIKNIFIVFIFSLIISIIIWLIDKFILYIFFFINNLGF